MPHHHGETMTQRQTDRLITVDEVARRYGIHPRTAIRFSKEDPPRIPPPLKAKLQKRPVWRESDIDKHLESLK